MFFGLYGDGRIMLKGTATTHRHAYGVATHQSASRRVPPLGMRTHAGVCVCVYEDVGREEKEEEGKRNGVVRWVVLKSVRTVAQLPPVLQIQFICSVQASRFHSPDNFVLILM